MQGWGHVPRHFSRKGETATYLCPWHDDHRPSLVVDRTVREDAADLGFKCYACGETGFGAIQLAARLMGLPAGKVSQEDLPRVLAELATRCNVKLEKEENGKPWRDTLRSSLTGWNEFKAAEPAYATLANGEAAYEQGAWTYEAIRALGFRIEIATRKAKQEEVQGGNGGADATAAEVRIGDMLTQFDPDTGEALYRCSLGSGFYGDPKKAETRTIEQWGMMIQQTFNVLPLRRFMRRDRLDNGGVVVITIHSTQSYPIFAFPYDFGFKKYEPYAIGKGAKWTWWNASDGADLFHRWYADSALTDALNNALAKDGVLPQQDERHPFVVTEKDKDGNPKKYRFNRVVLCSGPRDAMAVYSHSNAHVIWLHSEQAGFDKKGGNVRPNRWLRALLKQLQNVTVEGGLYVCYDEDATGLAASKAIALNSPQVRWLRLPKELGQVISGNAGTSGNSGLSGEPEDSAKPLKDVTDFVQRFSEVERLMPADVQHDDPCEWFDNALFDTPTCQFWQWESERKDADGTGRARYKFDLRNTPVFLRARGMVRRVVQQQEKDPFSRFFILGNDKTYVELFNGEKGCGRMIAKARDLCAEWLRAHKQYNDEKGSLSRAIYSAKLEQSVMEAIEVVDFNEKSFGEDFDYFFFKNTAVKVTKDGVETVPYSQLRWWTNQDAILDGVFQPVPQAWHVIVNPLYEVEKQKHEEQLRISHTTEEIAQENMRWDAWLSVWKYRLIIDRPLNEMPMHFQFLYNTCRIYWEREQAGAELTATERQVQDMYFITMMHALGSAMVRHRSANRQQFIHITDNGTRREDLASGGTGKTAILELLRLVRRVLSIDGKALEGGNIVLEQELGKVVPGVHNIVCLDELPDRFSPKKLYNYPLSVTSRGLYQGSIKLEGDDLPKLVLSSNEQIDLSSDSTSRRVYQVLVSDWYHPRSLDGSRLAHTPADDFRKDYGIKEVARNLPQALLNEARNVLLGCVQLYFQLPDETLRPPRDSRAMLRQALAATRDEQFTRWIAGYLSDKRHLAIPIAQRELAISLLDYCGITIGEKTLKAAYKRIRDNLEDYIRTSIYVVDPPVVLSTATDRENGFRRCAAWQSPKSADGYSVALDKDGNRLPRELQKKAPYPRVYYFYRKGTVPRNFYREDHIGDPDYVQPAPETDPDDQVTTK